MDPYIRLAYDSIKYYLENKTSLDTYDSYFKEINNGIIVKIEDKDRLKGESGSIYPTRKDVGLDIINESINAGFYSYTYKPITLANLDEQKITIYEFSDVEQIKFIEDFGDFDGICITFNEEVFIFYRKDYESDLAMFEDAIKKANLDSWDVFLIEKFRLKIHTSDE